jgi:hypothetical protein
MKLARPLSIFFAFVSLAAAASPAIRDIAPHGAQRGKTFKLVLQGSDLTAGARLETALPAAITRLTPDAEAKPETSLPFLIELKKDAPIGVYPLRVHTADGLSNLMLFSVGDLPETQEKEIDAPKPGNGTAATAEPIGAPLVINGSLPDADVDLFSFQAKAGQKLVFESEANVLASAIDPALEILDAAGKTIAKNDDAAGAGIDARLEVAFPRAGTYFVRIHDSKYSDQAQNFYRLKIGSYSFAEALFPIGGRRGEPVSVELLGGNLAAPVFVKPDTSIGHGFAPVSLPGSASLPQLFLLSDKPEMSEPSDRKLQPGIVVNGRIAAKGEADRYRLAVKPGEHWLFEVVASSTGASQLDALVTLSDAAGKKLLSRDDLFGADPTLPLEVPAGVQEIAVTVEDLLGRGGPAYGYRLEARREQADFTLQLSTPFVNVPLGGTAIVGVNINRRGYDGPMRIAIPNLPAGYRQAGGTVAPAAAVQRFDDPNPRFGRNTSTITITADADAKPQRLDLIVKGTADLPDGGRIVRFAGAPGLVVNPRGLKQRPVTAAWLGLPLAMASAKSLPARLVMPVEEVRVSQGVEYPLTYKVEGPAASRVQGRLRESVVTQVGNLRILQGPPSKTPGSGQLLINTNFATPMTRWDFLPQITIDMDGKPLDIYAPMVTFDVAPGYQVWPAASQWAVAPGASLTIAGRVHREPTFEGGLVKIEAQELPDGVSCAAIEVPAEVREFKLACQAAPTAVKGSFEVRLVSSAPDTGRKAQDTYKGPEVTGIIKVI